MGKSTIGGLVPSLQALEGAGLGDTQTSFRSFTPVAQAHTARTLRGRMAMCLAQSSFRSARPEGCPSVLASKCFLDAALKAPECDVV